MIKSLDIGHSPGDVGESLRGDRLNPSAGLSLEEASPPGALQVKGDDCEGINPQLTASANITVPILKALVLDISRAISKGTRKEIRICMVTLERWLMDNSEVLPNGNFVVPESDVAACSSILAQVAREQGDWYHHQLGCENRFIKHVLKDWRSGHLSANWYELQHSIIRRVHLLNSYELVLAARERRVLADRMRSIDWRPE